MTRYGRSRQWCASSALWVIREGDRAERRCLVVSRPRQLRFGAVVQRVGDRSAVFVAFDRRGREFEPELRGGRSENALYRLLGPPGADLLNSSAPHSDWAGLALSGDGWLHPGIDTGYGTPRFLLAAMVRSVAREFEALTEAVFLDRFEEVIRDADRLRGYLLPNYACLRRFYLAAARDEQAVIVTPM
jgi:hypothetical protein